MNETGDTGEVESYILSSTYRSTVLEYLAESGQATPKEVADSVGVPRPHVSRALSELQEKGVVELRVPEARTVGRYYGLTDKGERTWPEIRRQVRTVEWDVEEPTTPETRSVVELAKDKFDDSLRFVGMYDGSTVTIFHIDSEVRSEYTDEEFEAALRTLIFEHSIDGAELPSDECWSEVLHFSDFSVLRVRATGGPTVTISFDEQQNVLVPEFAETVESVFES